MDAGSFEGIDDNRRAARELCKSASRCAIPLCPGDPASTGCATCPAVVRQIASSLPPTISRFSPRFLLSFFFFPWASERIHSTEANRDSDRFRCACSASTKRKENVLIEKGHDLSYFIVFLFSFLKLNYDGKNWCIWIIGKGPSSLAHWEREKSSNWAIYCEKGPFLGDRLLWRIR